MSKQQSLSKAIVLSLLLSMPYHTVALGAGTDFNSEQVIGSAGLVADDTAGQSGNATANHRVEGDVSGAIEVSVTGGPGYTDSASGEYVSGHASNTLTIATDSKVDANIQLTATGGRSGHGSGVAWASSELVVIGDTIIEAKDILISSVAGTGGSSSYQAAGDTSIVTAGTGGLATAIGIKAESGVLDVNAQDLTATASGGSGGDRNSYSRDGGVVGGTGGAAQAYGLTTLGNSGAVSLRDVAISATGGAAGKSGSYKMNGVIGGNGGAADAYGWSGESSELSITMNSLIVVANSGAATNGAYGDNSLKTNGGTGGTAGMAQAYGFYAKSDNQLTLSVQDIQVTATAANGGSGGEGRNNGNGGSGSDGGAAVAYAVYADDNNQISGSLGDIAVQATAGVGGDGKSGHMGGSFIQGDGGNAGDGGAATAAGIYTHNATLDLEAKEVIIKAVGGRSGESGRSTYGLAGIMGVGGAAEAYGLHVLSSIGEVNLVRIEALATGGQRSSQGSGYGAGGAAAAYGLVMADSSQLTASVTADIVATATGGVGNHGLSSNIQTTKAGDGGAAVAHGVFVDNNSELTLTMGDLTATSQSGKGGDGQYISDSQTYVKSSGSDAASSGLAEAYGLYVQQDSQLAVTMNDIQVASTGGGAGMSGNYEEKSAASGGDSKAYALVADGSALQATFNQATVKATAGQGASGTQTHWWYNSIAQKGGEAGDGATAEAAGLHSRYSELTIEAKELSITAIGGAGGTGGSSYGDGGDAGAGGAALAYGLDMIGGTGIVEMTKIESTAIGGVGGAGGRGGAQGNSGNGGNGSVGGNATAYGIAIADKAQLIITLDSIAADAQAGAAGAAGIGNGTDKHDGTVGEQGKKAIASAVYATSGASLELHAANTQIDIGASANGSSESRAYSVYAKDNARVFFGSDVNLNKDKDMQDDNSAITYLDTATMGFVDSLIKDQSVGRQLTGGVLELHGSNTLRFATDLTNNTADHMSFDSLAANSTDNVQYITVAYDKSFDGRNDNSIDGKGTVLSFANLNGNNLSQFVGKRSEFDSPLNSFSATPTVEVSGNDVNITRIDFKTIGASDSVMIAADADMALRGIWRVETNNLMKRMGDLRNDSTAAKGGVWARYYGGQLNGNGGYGNNFDQNYNGFQAGIDKVQAYKDGKLVTGLMVNHIKGSSSYYAGSGDVSSTGMGIYTSWLGNKGHYVDVIARMSKLSNSFKLFDKSDNFASGDYSKWAYGISAEYGYRKSLNNGWFVEPQVELALGHINSGEYTMSNGLQVKQDAISTFTGRLGVLTGKTFKNQGGVGNTYFKASVLHEFSGNGSAQAYYQGNGLSIQSGDMSGTWCELGVGANVPLSNKSNLYFDALKTFGGKMKSNWQVNVGLRFGF